MAFLSGRMIWEFEYRRSKVDKIYRRIRTVYTIANTGDCKQPVLKIKSTHTDRGAEGANYNEADGLEPQLCICLGARVMLTDNIWVENGLVNRLMGTVRDIVWNEGQDPIKDMPTAIMVEVDDYDGPKFLAPTTFPSSPSPGDSNTKNVTVRARTFLCALPMLSRYTKHKD